MVIDKANLELLIMMEMIKKFFSKKIIFQKESHFILMKILGQILNFKRASFKEIKLTIMKMEILSQS
jgi:hypothetical protein